MMVTRPAHEYLSAAKLIAEWLRGRLLKQAKEFKFAKLNLISTTLFAATNGNNFGLGRARSRPWGELSAWPEDDESGSLRSLPEKKEKATLDI